MSVGGGGGGGVISAQKVLFGTLFLIGFVRFLCTNCYN